MNATVTPAKSGGTSKACYECGAPLDAQATTCWMCAAEQPVLAIAIESPPPVAKPPTDVADNPWLIHGMIWGVVSVAALVGYGYFQQVYQQGIAFAVAIVPPLIIMLLAAATSRGLGNPIHPAVKVLALVGIMCVTVPLALLVAIFIACLPKS